MDAQVLTVRAIALAFVCITSLAGCKSPYWSEFWGAGAAEDASSEARLRDGVLHPAVKPGARSAAQPRPWADGEEQQAIDALSSSDPRSRIAAINSLVAHRHPRAQEFLQFAAEDKDASVRVAAIAGLGQLGTEQARATLRQLQDHPSEVSRAAALAALGSLGIDEATIDAAADKSLRVRQAAADALANAPRRAAEFRQETIAQAQELIRDVSADVQLHAVDSVSQWPAERAVPALLLALGSNGYQTRKAAAARLTELWGPAADFPVDGSPGERQAALAELNRRWLAEASHFDEVVATAREVEQTVRVSAQRLRELEEALRPLTDPNLPAEVRRAATEALVAVGPEVVVALEQRAIENAGPLPKEIYTDVLPRVSALYATIEALNTTTAAQRRVAAAELARQTSQAAGQMLSDLALARLVELVETESDPVVWQSVFAIVANDSRQAAVRLAREAETRSQSGGRKSAKSNR